MSVGDYVSVKIPSSNKIVAGLVEEINDAGLADFVPAVCSL